MNSKSTRRDRAGLSPRERAVLSPSAKTSSGRRKSGEMASPIKTNAAAMLATKLVARKVAHGPRQNVTCARIATGDNERNYRSRERADGYARQKNRSGRIAFPFCHKQNDRKCGDCTGYTAGKRQNRRRHSSGEESCDNPQSGSGIRCRALPLAMGLRVIVCVREPAMASIAPALAEVRTLGHRPANNTDVSTPPAMKLSVSENNAITAAMAREPGSKSSLPEFSLWFRDCC